MPRVTGKLMGRCGNQFYQIATTYAYALKHGLDPYVTSFAQNGDNNAYYFKLLPTNDGTKMAYFERTDSNGYAIYQEIPYFEDAMLIGYWQSFNYINDYRKEILDLFNLPYKLKEKYISIHVRRGDYLTLNDRVSVLGTDYYEKAIRHFSQIGDFSYLVFSDDINWCMENFPKIFPEEKIEFFNSKNEVESIVEMSCCEHNICANSSFSYVASWLNQNGNKTVITPDYNKMISGHNKSMIPDNYIRI